MTVAFEVERIDARETNAAKRNYAVAVVDFVLSARARKYVRRQTVITLCSEHLSDCDTYDDERSQYMPEVRAVLSRTYADCVGCAALHRLYPDSM